MLAVCVGNVGSGKTLFLTICGYLSKLNRERVVANYALKGAETLDLRKFAESTYENAVILLDEAYIYLESRASTQKMNVLLSYALFQSRKKSIILLLSVQLFLTIDLRFRNLVDTVIYCSHDAKNQKFIYDIVNMHNYATRTLSLSESKAQFFYSLYNTNEVVKNNLDGQASIFDSLESREEKIKRLKSIVSEIMHDREKISKLELKKWVFEHGYSTKDESILYAMCKEQFTK